MPPIEGYAHGAAVHCRRARIRTPKCAIAPWSKGNPLHRGAEPTADDGNAHDRAV